MTRTGACGVCLFLFGGCTVQQMALPADVAQASEALPISDRSGWSGAFVDESFNLGNYRVSDVDRKWDSTRSSHFFNRSASSTSGGYTFKLAGDGNALDGECATEAREHGASFAGGISFSALVAKLGCNCGDASGNAELELEAGNGAHYEGTLKTSGGEFHVSTIHEREGGTSSVEPTGYRVDGSNGPVGAVDVLNTGRAWLSKTLAGRARAEVACTFAGLLLYKPPSDR
jgi:hypothetical protein